MSKRPPASWTHRPRDGRNEGQERRRGAHVCLLLLLLMVWVVVWRRCRHSFLQLLVGLDHVFCRPPLFPSLLLLLLQAMVGWVKKQTPFLI